MLDKANYLRTCKGFNLKRTQPPWVRFAFDGGWDVQVLSAQPIPMTKRLEYCMVMLVIVYFLCILSLDIPVDIIS